MFIVTGLQVGSITFSYVNHRRELSVRRVKPLSVYYGSTEWHQEPQWLMEGYDEEKKATRTFALKDMKPVS